jgi:hypothetical protein
MNKISKAVVATAILAATSGSCFALDAQTNFTITSNKLNSNGTLSVIETVPAQTDASGKLTFSLTSLPTKNEVNFLAFTIKDGKGNMVRQGLVPAPPTNDVNKLGINDLATAQTAAFLKAAQLAGTDDPVLAAYLLVLLRFPNLQDSDVVKIANLAKAAIVPGNGGFEDYLLANGTTQGQLTSLRQCLIYNPDETKSTLRDITKGFFTALESGNAATETTETQKAGGRMADVFLAAAACANIDLDYITNAHEAAGAAADGTGLMSGPQGISANLMSSIDQSMSAFNHKIGGVKMVAQYTGALTALQGSGSQVDTFITAAQAMAAANNSVDAQYGDYFKDPAAYLAAHQGSDAQSIQNAINSIYQSAWTTFQNAIAASNADIAALKTAIIAAFPGIQLPADFGINNDGSQTPPNWPVQQVVMVKWMVKLIQDGGSINYTRDTLPIPAGMQMWMGSCSKQQYWNQQICQQQGGTWTVGRRSFETPSVAFNAYLGIQQDVQIADMARNDIWNNNNQPTQVQRMQAKADFVAHLAAIQGNIVATKAGGASASAAEKKAIITLMLQPQND